MGRIFQAQRLPESQSNTVAAAQLGQAIRAVAAGKQRQAEAEETNLILNALQQGGDTQASILEALSARQEDAPSGVLGFLDRFNPFTASRGPSRVAQGVIGQTFQQRFVTEPAARARSGAAAQKRQDDINAVQQRQANTEVTRLRKAIVDNREEHRRTNRFKSQKDVEVGTVFHSRLSEELTALDVEKQQFEDQIRQITQAFPAPAKAPRRRKRRATTQPAATPQSAAAPVAPAAGVTEEPTATNPATGQRIVFRNGQWVPVP